MHCMSILQITAILASLGLAAPTVSDSATATSTMSESTIEPLLPTGEGKPEITTLNVAAITFVAPNLGVPTGPPLAGGNPGLPVIPLPAELPVDHPVAQLLAKMEGTNIIVQNDTQADLTPYAMHLLESAYIAENYTNDENASSGIAERQSTLKVLAIGDSITQGAEGDWTWRWRMWEWFRDNGIPMQFVGPYKGTLTPWQPGPPPIPSVDANPNANYGSISVDGVYAKTDGFGRAANMDNQLAHFAIWGRTIAYDLGLIQDIVSTAKPDMILLLLGYNDLAWTGAAVSAEDVIRRMDDLLSRIRGVAPNVKIAMGNVVQPTWFGQQIIVDKINEYNSKLVPTIEQRWNKPGSPVYLADVRKRYSCNAISCPAGYDGLHPDAQGEYEIAAAFSETLYSKFGLGRGPLTIPNPIPQRSMGSIQGFTVASSPRGVTVTWTHVFGAYNYDIEITVNDGPVTKASSPFARYDTTWPFDGAKYGFRVRASAGNFDYLKSAWSGWQYATATPKLAGPPNNPKTYPLSDGARIIMDPATGPNIDSIAVYQIIWWDMDYHCAFISGTPFKPQGAGATYTLSGFMSGHRLLIAPASWNANGLGFPAGARTVRTGNRGGLSAPGSFTITNRNNGNSQFSWSPVSGAAGYVLWSRNTLENNQTFSTMPIDETCWDGIIFYPYVWNYEYCIGAYNGEDTSPTRARCSQMSQPTADNPSPAGACPAPSQWCPEFYNGGPAPAATNAGIPPAATNPVDVSGGGGGGTNPGSGSGTTTKASQTTSTGQPAPSGPSKGDVDLPYCEDEGTYTSLDQLMPGQSNLPGTCTNLYTLNIMQKNLTGSMSQFNSLMANGYRSKFNAYANVVKQQRYWTWNDKVHTPKNGGYGKFWTCYETVDGKNKTVDCGQSPGGQAFYFVPKGSFCNDFDALGLDCSHVTYKSGTYTLGTTPECQVRGGCQGTQKGTIHYPDFDYRYDVEDPSTAVAKSVDNYNNLAAWLEETYYSAAVVSYPAKDNDLVDGASVMVYTTSAVVNAMAEVAEIGENEIEEARKRVIISFITAILFVVPFIGEAAAGVAALQTVARALRLLDNVGNVALDIYGVVQDPNSAPQAIAGALLGGLAARDKGAWRKAGADFRKMDRGIIDKLGGNVATNLGKVKQITKQCAL